MAEKREVYTTPHVRISYPVFDCDLQSEREMSAFYASLFNVLKGYAEEITSRRDGGSRTFTADYVLRENEGEITVACRIAVRRRGRTVAAKSIAHVWSNGVLVQPGRSRRKRTGLHANLRRLLTRTAK